MDDVLSRQCFVCGDLYGEHTLDSLAECMESVNEMLEEGYDGWDADARDIPWTRTIETIATGRYL